LVQEKKKETKLKRKAWKCLMNSDNAEIMVVPLSSALLQQYVETH
jgi:hypothetical protein